jgi:hypothetical protein
MGQKPHIKERDEVMQGSKLVLCPHTFNNVGFGLKSFASDIEPFWEKSSRALQRQKG